MKAIRIDKTEVLYGKSHIDLIFQYKVREELSDDDLDKMIDENRIEFGAVFMNRDMILEFGPDDSRNAVYTSVDKMIEVGGR